MKNKYLLDISDLTVSIDKRNILKLFNLNINKGETHVIMGKNGAGKSTLARVLTGCISGYNGSVFYNGVSIDTLSPDELSLKGLFLSFQYPVIIPGLTTLQFLRTMINSHRKYRHMDPVDTSDFLYNVKNIMNKLGMKEELLYRCVNDGFSGGEKKKNEILQMLLIKPTLSILDEVDSGLDIDALKCVANGINLLKSNKTSFLIITHYNRILNYIDVDYVHIMHEGKIVKTGNKDLAFKLEKLGYSIINK